MYSVGPRQHSLNKLQIVLLVNKLSVLPAVNILDGETETVAQGSVSAKGDAAGVVPLTV